MLIARNNRGDSGLLLMATEQSRVLSYYVPTLGPAPRWCSFLDVLTEELEEEGEASVYEDYKFVTAAEVCVFFWGFCFLAVCVSCFVFCVFLSFLVPDV